MTATPLPGCGIWTTDMEGERIIGFTSEQFLSVWQARADLEAENQRLREALRIAHDHIDMNALRVSHCKDAATITATLESKP